MLRRVAVLLALLAGLVSEARALPAAPGAGDPNIVIGVIATLSGPGAIAGQDLVDGFTIAMRHLGGRFANQEVRVVVNDDRGSPDIALQAVRRMLEREKVDIVLTGVSQASLMAIVGPLETSRVFVLNLDTAPAALAGPECSPWLFDLGTPAEGVHEAAGLYFTNEKVRRLVVVGPDSPITADAVAALKRTFTGEVVATLMPRHGATTYPGEIAQLRRLRPDAVYTLLTGGMGVDFVREYDAAGLKAEMPLAGSWLSFERPMLPAMAEAASDVPNIGPWSFDLDTPQNRRLVTDFDAEYGRSATSWVAEGYDAGLLLDAALKTTNGRTSDADALRAALRRAEFPSVRGAFRFNSNHFPVVNLYLRRVGRDAKGRANSELKGVLLKDWRDHQAARCPMRWTEEPASKPGTATTPKPGAPAKPPAAAMPAKPKPR
jgi:branched-chain amino acid transport system substrate-binding protein